MKFYKYGMRDRGYAPFHQPSGVIALMDGDNGYHNYIVYDHELSVKEKREYRLDLMEIMQ